LPRQNPDKVLEKWEEDKWASAENRQQLVYIIIVELLAYQFASPVRWIKTQGLLFSSFNFERLAELGPSPTLAGMATRTLKAKYEAIDGSICRTHAILCHSKNVKEIYYQYEDEAEAPPAESASGACPSAPPAAAAATAAPVAIAAPTGPVARIEDVPVKAIDILLVVVAQKLKKRIDEIPLSKTIKHLVGRKLTLENEILGDLQQEFASAPEKGEEFPLEELGSALGSGFQANGSLGKYSTDLVSRLVGGKTQMVSMLPLSRVISLKPGVDRDAAGAGGGGGGGTVINSKFLKFQADQEKFAAQRVELYMHSLVRDSRAGELVFDQEKANSIALQAKLDSITHEHGDAYIEGCIQPRFDATSTHRGIGFVKMPSSCGMMPSSTV